MAELLRRGEVGATEVDAVSDNKEVRPTGVKLVSFLADGDGSGRDRADDMGPIMTVDAGGRLIEEGVKEAAGVGGCRAWLDVVNGEVGETPATEFEADGVRLLNKTVSRDEVGTASTVLNGDVERMSESDDVGLGG